MMLELAFAVSNHMTEGDFNEQHLNLKLREGNYFATAYHNSEDSLSLGVGYTFGAINSSGLFLDAAVVSGYDYGPVLPMIRGGYDTGKNVRFWAAPSVTPEGDVFGIIGLEVYITVGD